MSSYAIWSHIKKEAKEKGPDNINLKVMAYNNVNKRIANLVENGLLEDMKLGESLHGRKDYKVSIKGLECLMPHIITHPQDARTITQYIDRFALNKRDFGDLLVNNVVSMINSVDQYLGSIKNLDYKSMMNLSQIGQMQKPLVGSHERLRDMYDALYIEQSKQESYTKSKTGHKIKFTSKLVPERGDPRFEQVQKELKRGLSSRPEIADSELAEDLHRMEQAAAKSKSTGVRPIPSAASRKKASAPLKKKQH